MSISPSIPNRLALRTEEQAQHRVTYSGWVLFLIGLSLIGSGFTASRVMIAGLLVHPYLGFVVMLFPLLAATRLSLIPTRFTLHLIAFASLYFVATFSSGVAIGDGLKLAASVVTILTVAMLVRTWGDFTAGIAGMAVAVAVLAYLGIQADSKLQSGSIEAIEGANRNAYSLYALPPLLLGAYVLMRNRSESLLTRGLLVVSLLITTLCICLNTNRSGWLGLALVMLMMAYEKSVKAALVFAAIGSLMLFLLVAYFGTEHLERRVMQTRQGNRSDEVRWQLFITSIHIGLEHPLLGVSPHRLHRELALRLNFEGSEIDSHNLYAHLIGGCGLVCFALFIWFGHALWTWRPPPFVNYRARFTFVEARKLLRYTMVLYAIRGIFSADILFSPSFAIAIGLGMGVAVVNSLPAKRFQMTSARRRLSSGRMA